MAKQTNPATDTATLAQAVEQSGERVTALVRHIVAQAVSGSMLGQARALVGLSMLADKLAASGLAKTVKGPVEL